MIKNLSLAVIFILACSVRLTSQVNIDDTIKVYQEIAGDYEYYSDLQYYYFNLHIENKILIFRGLDSCNIHKTIPVDLVNLKFKISDSTGGPYLYFKRNINDEIYSCRLITNGSECLALKQNEKSYPDHIADELYSVEALRADLIQIKDILINIHPAVYQFTSKELFEKIFNEQYSKINRSMNLREFYRIATPVVTLVHCGHTVLILPDKFWDNERRVYFPMRLTFIKGKAYVNSFYDNQNLLPLWSEILSVNGIPMSEIFASATPLISADGYNESFKPDRLGLRFQDFFNICYGFYDYFDIEYLQPGSKFVNSIKFDGVKRCFDPQSPGITAGKTSTGDSNLDLEIDRNKDLAVMTIKSFYYSQNKEKFYWYIDKAFKEISNNNIHNLILDLRNNFGGDGYCASHLFSYLESTPVPYFAQAYYGAEDLDKPIPLAPVNHFAGKVYVLTNGGCFSATGQFCSLLKFHKMASFIGMPTGSTFECNSVIAKYNPRETRMTLIVARMSFAAAVKGFPRGNGIMPDYFVEPAIEDLVKGKDTVKEFAFGLIEKSKSQSK
jgi:hypothetical protein